MQKELYGNYLEILREELVPAMGCTEPIAIAYAAAKARAVLGTMPEKIHVSCSGNIIKNVKGVIVPNSGNQKGIEAAAVLGVVEVFTLELPECWYISIELHYFIVHCHVIRSF